jgi:hypothetical protein
MTNALLHRLDPGRHPLTDAGGEWNASSLLSMARAALEAQNVDTAVGNVALASMALGLAPVLTRSGLHTISDFPTILANVGRATLTQGYTLAPRTFVPWCRRTALPDFRVATRVSLGSAPQLRVVPEGAEYTHGTIAATGQPIRLVKYGRMMAFSWDAIVNDDINLLQRIGELLGAGAAQVEGDVVYDVLLSTAPRKFGTSQEFGAVAGL